MNVDVRQDVLTRVWLFPSLKPPLFSPDKGWLRYFLSSLGRHDDWLYFLSHLSKLVA